MMSKKEKTLRKSILAFLSLSVSLGFGMTNVQAAAGAYTVTDKNETIDVNKSYSGNAGSSNPTSVLYVPASVSGGTITVRPMLTGSLAQDGRTMQGKFTGSASDTSNAVNMSMIQIGSGYTGELKIEQDPIDETGKWTVLELTGNGAYQNGAVIYSSQEGTDQENNPTNINVGSKTQIIYKVNNPTDANMYGIYNAHGNLVLDDNVSINSRTDFNNAGIIGTSDSGSSSIYTSGIFNFAGASASIGNNLYVNPTFSSIGSVKGVISGIDSGRKEDTERNTFNMGDNGYVAVGFTGKGLRSKSVDVLKDENTLDVRGMYIANSDFAIGNNDGIRAFIGPDSTASVVAGTGITNSSGTIGDDFDTRTTIDYSNSAADLLTGIRIDDNSTVTAGDRFFAEVTNSGYTTQADAVGVFSNSTLKMGNRAGIISMTANDPTGTVSSDKGDLFTAVHAEENSKVSVGDNAWIKTYVSEEEQVSTIANINLADSQMTIGKNAELDAVGRNHVYDGNSQLYNVNVFNSDVKADEKADIQIGEGAYLETVGNNFGTIAGVRNSINGTASLGDNSTISTVLTPTGDAGDVQPGSNQYIAGYKGVEAKKTTLGNNVSISVLGTTDQTNSTAYGSDNAYGELEAGDNLTVALNTKGYDASYGLSTIGQDRNHTGNTVVGNDLNVSVIGDGYAYGIYNGASDVKEGYANTSGGNNTNISVKGNSVAGVYSTGSNSAVALGANTTINAESSTTTYGIFNNAGSDVTLGDNAVLNTQGSRTAYGIFNQNGSNTTLSGAAEITSKKGDDLSWAAASLDEGSLIDITGAGRKLINGNLYSGYNGKLLLDMATGDSVLTGMSKINGGITNIEMSNGSLWNMTKDSAVTNLSVSSGATVDMAYNKDDYQTLTVGNFSGNDGILHMKTDLASETDGDKMTIDSAAAGSKGLISVYDKSLVSGKEVMGTKHLLMVTDKSQNTTFSGKSLNTGGLWEITPTIERGSTFTDANGSIVGTPDQWYLVSIKRNPNADTQPLIEGGDNIYGLYRMSIDTLRQRLGDLRYRNRSEDRYDVWARNRNGRFAGNGYDSKYNFFQVGVDTMPDAKSAYGFLVERGVASPEYEKGNGMNHTLAGAAYATWLGDHGDYTDVVAKMGRNDATIHTFGEYPDSAQYRAKERSLSVEYGRKMELGKKGYFVEPQVQLVMGHLNSNSYTTSRGTHVFEDSFDSSIGRVGFVFGKKNANNKMPYDFYMKASVLHEFGGDRNYTMDRVNAAGDAEHLDGKYSYGDTWFELGLGSNIKVNEHTNFYADVEKSFASDFNKKWQFNAGINYSW